MIMLVVNIREGLTHARAMLSTIYARLLPEGSDVRGAMFLSLCCTAGARFDAARWLLEEGRKCLCRGDDLC